MPGAVAMENGAPNGARTDHDRNQVNGAGSYGMVDAPAGSSKALPQESGESGTMMNGGEVQNPVGTDENAMTVANLDRMNDLPDEIQHITDGFVSISNLLRRLSQHTHNVLEATLEQLARMPLPSSAGAMVNGNSGTSARSGDEYDVSGESVQKKVAFLNFLQMHRGKWIKALVITNWSRNSTDVSKLIDLRDYLWRQTMEYNQRLDELAELKRNLHFARVPSPDLKTAYQVLSSGKADWMPDMRHIEPPSLSNEEHEQRLEELNIALFERLNLVDHDKIPWHFRDFTIDGGVATFKVKGEFEVDLTVGDEDAESQFWFIDLRFAFMPVPEEPSPRLKGLLERQVNQWLGEDGLRGCYNRLHEYVLTTKVNELRRQAYELSHTSWAKTLSLTTLDRGFAIQYWTNRQPQSTWIKRGSRGSDGPPKVPKSWIIVSVRSPRQIGGESREEATSSLAATWFRDGKEVKDATIEFDHDRLSADRLLKTVIAKHVSHILTAIHTKLRLAPRFMNRESALSLYISATEPSESYLSMELSSTENVSLRIEPSTGQFTFHPHNRPTLQGEAKLNHYSVDPAEVGARCLESIRWGYLADEVVRKGRPMGWTLAKNPHDLDQARGMCKIRREEACQAIYLQREGVDKDKGWYVMLMMSLQGDKWMAFQESAPNSQASTQASRYIRKEGIPLSLQGQPGLSPAFWDHLTAYFAAIIAHNVDQGGLHRQGLRFKTLLNRNLSLPSQLSIPSIVVKLSDILPNAVASSPTKFSEVEKVGGNATDASQARTTTELPAAQLATGGSQTKPTVKTQAANRTPWARDHVEIKYRNTAYSNEDADRTRLAYSADALVTVLDKRKFPMLKSKVGRDVLYNPIKGQFCIRLQASVGAPMMDKLKDRLKSVDRVVDCIDAMNHSRNTLKCESVTLQKVVFTYEDTMHRLLQQHLQQLKATESSAPSTASQPKRWQATLDLSGPQIKIEFEKGNPHTRILDILTTIVNQPDGICVLTEVLPQTIHPLSCLDRITASWRDLTKKNLGMPIVTHRTVDWFTICYDLPENATRTRSLRIDFKARRRDGKLYWYISRADPSVPGQPAGQPPQDIFAEKFKRVFQLKSVGTVGQWRGLGNGATMSGDGPLMALLALDQCVREAVVWADSSQGQQQGQQQGQRGAPGQARGTPQQGVRGIPNPGQASRK